MGEYFGLFFSYKMTLMFFYYYLKCVCCCRKHPSQGKDMGIAGAQGLFLLCVQMRQEVCKRTSHRKAALVICSVVSLNILTPN